MAKKILLVEDEALIAMNEAKMLEKHGYEVVTVYNGEKAIEAVDSDSDISLILMDIDLGKGMDGTETAERILEKHDLPIAFLSSHTESEIVERTEGITSFGYIVKNSGETVILASIKMAFRLFEAHQELKRQKENLNTTLVKYEQTAEELAEKNEELERYFNSSLDMLCITDTEGRFIRLNPEWEKALGYSVTELEGRSFFDFIHPEDRDATLEAVAKLKTGKNVENLENRFRCRDGSYRWIEWRSKAIGTTIYAAARDITERKEAEKGLLEREALYRNLMENSIDGVELLDEEGNYLDVNQRECEMLGYSREELLNMKIADIDPNYPKEGFYHFWKDQPKGTSVLFETLHRHKDGTLIPVEVNGIFFTVGEKKYIFGVARDIRDRKQSEHEIKSREKNLRTTLNSIGDAVISTDIDGNIVRMNPVAENITGWSAVVAYGKKVNDIFHIINADTREVVDNPVEKVIQSGKILDLANHTVLISKDGYEYQIADSAAPIKDDEGNINGVVLVFRDVSEKYEKERQLEENEKRYRVIVENINDALIIHDFDGVITFVNETTCTLLNYTRDELIGTTFVDLHEPTHRDFIQNIIRKNGWHDLDLVEVKLVSKDGNVTPVEINTKIVSREGTGEIQTVVRDIRERRNTEELLLQKERHYRFIYNSLRDALIIVNANREITDCNTAFTELFGYTLKEIQGKTTAILFASKDEYEQLGRMMQEQEEDSDFIYQPLYRTKTGEVFRGEKKIQYLKDENGKPMGFIGVIGDITEQKQLEEQLKKNEERFKTIFYNSEVSLWEEDFSEVRQIIEGLKEEGVSDFYRYFDNNPNEVWELAKKIRVIDINDATLRLYDAKTKEEMLGSLEKTLYLTEDTYSILREELIAIAEKRTSVKGEMKTKTLYGEVLDITMSIYISEEKDIMIAALNDVTPYKKSLEEKDFLMRELNHRVKNNLNMVSSLISLKDVEIDCELSDLKHRIDAIRLVHEKLHQYGDAEHIKAHEYIQEILESVFSSFSAQKVDIVNTIEEVSLHPRTLVPLGIVINEIATNAIKYGFTDYEEARFSVDMRKDSESTHYTLTLSNTGNPFPEEIGLENPETMGLQLISSLVAQLNGTVELQKKPTPVFTIRFPVEVD